MSSTRSEWTEGWNGSENRKRVSGTYGSGFSCIGKQHRKQMTLIAAWQMNTTLSASAYESTAAFFKVSLRFGITEMECLSNRCQYANYQVENCCGTHRIVSISLSKYVSMSWGLSERRSGNNSPRRHRALWFVVVAYVWVQFAAKLHSGLPQGLDQTSWRGM